MKKLLLIVLALLTLFIGGICFADEEKDHICFSVVDANSDGKVTLQEFVDIFGDNKEKFAASDLNTDGILSHDEYHQSLGHGAT